MADSEPLIRMTADEINCLVHAFLIDSGFKHAAFNLCSEARLEESPNFSKYIPRGELIDLLSKSLLYREVESHWKADNLALNCKVGFSLLEPHICSLEPPKKTPHAPAIYTQRPLMQSSRAANGVDGKRKGSPLGDGPAEKRLRREDDGDVMQRRPLKPKVRQQGPGDSETDPRAILILSGHETEVFVCAFNPTKPSILVTGSKDAVLNKWDLPQPPLATSPEFAQAPLTGPHRMEYSSDADPPDITSLHWNYDGSLIAMGSYDRILRVCSAAGDLYFSSDQHQSGIFAARFSKNGKWLLSASLDGTACIWDVAKRELHTKYSVGAECLDVDWLSDTIFGSCTADGKIYIMDIGKPEPIRTLTGHGSEINQIKFNAAGTRLASGSDDQTARIWKIEDLERPVTEATPGLGDATTSIVLSGHIHSVNTIHWCPETTAGQNPLLATSSFDNTARLWDTVTGACLHVFADHKRSVYAVKFSPSGRWIATCSGDGWLHVYDFKTREMRWSWFAGFDKPGIFEIDWETGEGVDRIALALECRGVAVIDVLKVPALQRT
ncbi:WD40 repeat-like protein [Mycena amicta]|nr:WD40 repeat-like protein [Mycena amicta]